MSRVCAITLKGRQNGHKVSHANNKKNKVWSANLHWKRIYDSTTKTWFRIKLSARVLRTIDKKGLSATLRDNGICIGSSCDCC